MQWVRMQQPLRQGQQVFRESWPDDRYIIVKDGELQMFSDEELSGVAVSLSSEDVGADDWMATGPSGM